MTTPTCFTPETFHAQIASLLVGYAHRTASMRMCQLSVITTVPTATTGPTDSSVKTCPHSVLEVHAELSGPRTSTATTTTTRADTATVSKDANSRSHKGDGEQDEPLYVHTVLRIRGDAQSISTLWCTSLQRVFSVVSLLLSPSTDDEEGEEGAENDEDAASHVRQGRTSENPRVRADVPFSTTSVRPRWSLRYFTVDLDPLVPHLEWDREVDGTFGSVYAIVQRGVLTLCRRARTHEEGDGAYAKAGEASTKETRYAVRVAAMLNAAVPPPSARVLRAYAERANNDGDDNDDNNSKRDSSSGGVRSRCVPTASCVVMHAPGASLLTGRAGPTASGPRRPLSPSSSDTLFEALAHFASQHLMPAVRFEDTLGASLARVTNARHGFDGCDDVCRLAALGTSYTLTWAPTDLVQVRSPSSCAATAQASTRNPISQHVEPQTHKEGVAMVMADAKTGRGAASARDACDAMTRSTRSTATWAAHDRATPEVGSPLPAAAPSSPTKKRSTTATSVMVPHPSIQNLVFVLDVPLSAWSALLALQPHDSTDDRQRLAAALSQLTALMERAVARLVHRHTDICFFHSKLDASSCTSGGRGKATMSAGSYTRQVLTQSIAESVTAILFHSRNPDFVKEAERILFSTTPTPLSQTTEDKRRVSPAAGLHTQHGAAHNHTQASSMSSTEGSEAGMCGAEGEPLDGQEACDHEEPALAAAVTHRYTAKQVCEAIEAALR